MQLAGFLEQILVVIVVYKKQVDEVLQKVFPFGLEKLAVFVYDNSPARQEVGSSVIYEHDVNNSGVSKAYNRALEHANHLQKTWMLLLDQDTICSQTFYDRLYTAVLRYSDQVAFAPKLYDEVGIVSPFRWTRGKGHRLKYLKAVLPLNRYRFVNSGLLVRCDAFKKAGGYIESIPLDFSDIAFGERLRRVTDHFVVVDDQLKHEFSATQTQTYVQAAHRFEFYCRGAFAMGKTFNQTSLFAARALLRGLKLSVRYKNISFINTFVKFLLND